MNIEKAKRYYEESERLRQVYENIIANSDGGHFVVPIFEHQGPDGLVEGVYFTSDHGLCYSTKSSGQDSVNLWPFDMEELTINSWDEGSGPLSQLEPEQLAQIANEQILKHFQGVISSVEDWGGSGPGDTNSPVEDSSGGQNDI